MGGGGEGLPAFIQGFSKYNTHRHNLHQSKTALSLLVGKELAEEHPGLFREAFENMCFPVSASPCPQLCSPRREATVPSGSPWRGKGGVPGFPGKRTEPRNPGVCPQAVGGKRGYRGLSPYCIPGVLSVLCPCETRSGELETKTQRWNLT